MILPAGLAPLLKEVRWLLWKMERGTKVPYQGRHPEWRAKSDDASTWCEWGVVSGAWDAMRAEGVGGGAGFALTDGEWIVIDLDKCRDVDTEELAAWAVAIVDKARALGAYVEISVSGTGVHVWGRGTGGVPAKKTIRMPHGGKIELFRRATRYITVSGRELGRQGSVDVVIDELVDELAGWEGVASSDALTAGGGKSKSGIDTSQLSFAECARMFGQGLSVDEVVEHLRRHPGKTKTAEFDGRGGAWNLAQDVASCYARWSSEKGDVLAVKWTHGAVPKNTVADTRVALAALGLRVYYDTFHLRLMIAGLGEEEGEEVSDQIVQELRLRVWEKFRVEVKKAHMIDALEQLGNRDKRDPVLEYLMGLKWDGVARLDTWVVKALGCRRTEANCAIGRMALIAGVRRVREPGCKFDQIIVLEGEEGLGKSSAIELLAVRAENFSDQSILSAADERQQERLGGVWQYEIAELRGIKWADADHIKSFASRRVDRARPAYGRFVLQQKRRCVLWATTNDTEYLKSPTGNRRWWPLECLCIDLDWLRANVDQLWAEAVVAEREHRGELQIEEGLWPQIEAAQAAREMSDPWLDDLAEVTGKRYPRRDKFAGEEERVAANFVLRTILGMRTEACSSNNGKRVAQLMKKLGWKRARLRLTGRGNMVWCYWRYAVDARTNVVHGRFAPRLRRREGGEE
jgi:putative DNA primase/helicase